MKNGKFWDVIGSAWGSLVSIVENFNRMRKSRK